MSPLNAWSMGLTREGFADELAAPSSAAATGVLPVVVIPRTRLADVVSGFPQSMQNRDDASFSRPQKAHVARELTEGRGGTCGANIPGAVGFGPAGNGVDR